MKIFLAHKSVHKPLIREFRKSLPVFLETWLDEDSLSWGDSLEELIHKTIKDDVDYVLLFLQDESLKSEWVRRELCWALAREKALERKFILPIIIEDTAPLPPDLGDRLYLRLADFSAASIRHIALVATDRIFELVLKSWPSDESHIRSFVRTLVAKHRSSDKYWTRKLLPLPLPDRSTRLIHKFLKAAVTAVKRLLSKTDETQTKIRANIFLPTTDAIHAGDPFNLTIPSSPTSIVPSLSIGMTDQKELGMRLRPRDGATGRVFSDQRAIGTIVNPEWIKAKIEKADLRNIDRWIYVSLSPDESSEEVESGVENSDTILQMSSNLEDVVHENLSWIVSVPIFRAIDGQLATVGVLNVDCIDGSLNPMKLRQVFAVVAPFAAAIAGVIQDARLDEVAILKF